MEGATEVKKSTSQCTDRSHSSEFIRNGSFIAEINGQGIVTLGISDNRGNQGFPVITKVSETGKLFDTFGFVASVIRTFRHLVGGGLVELYIQFRGFFLDNFFP